MNARTQVTTGLILLSIFFAGVIGCAPRSAEPTVPPASVPVPTLQPGWQTLSASADEGQCGYAIDHPSDLEAASQGTFNWLLSFPSTEPNGPFPNFIYISVIPDGFQSSEPGAIYNYDPAETQTLLSMQVGESQSLRGDPNSASSFTYTRLPDRTVGTQAAQAYENTQPWEFPLGTKEVRYYLQGNRCTYLIGGYMSTVGSGQPGAMDEELFDQIIATFRLAP